MYNLYVLQVLDWGVDANRVYIAWNGPWRFRCIHMLNAGFILT